MQQRVAQIMQEGLAQFPWCGRRICPERPCKTAGRGGPGGPPGRFSARRPGGQPADYRRDRGGDRPRRRRGRMTSTPKESDVVGLVKLVDLKEPEENDWSLTPGRYVGIAPEEEDEDFDFEQTMREIHLELDELDAEAVQLAKTIKRNFEDLGI